MTDIIIFGFPIVIFALGFILGGWSAHCHYSEDALFTCHPWQSQGEFLRALSHFKRAMGCKK